MPSPVADRFRRWALAEAPALPVARFRTAFALVWLLYDVLDLWCLGTARIHNWLATETPPRLLAVLLGLIACEVVMLVGEPLVLVVPATVTAAWIRALEWRDFVRLNDFAYFAVTAIILAHARPTGSLFARRPTTRMVPRWPRDVLVWQAAWIYFATGLMKLNPSWLSGRHLYVRLQYLEHAFGWPFPPPLVWCADTLPCDAALGWIGVLGELTLALLLVFYPRRRVVGPLVVGIHTFGALATNVWFFGPSLIAQVILLTDPVYSRDGEAQAPRRP
jgi:hypothetical protein